MAVLAELIDWRHGLAAAPAAGDQAPASPSVEAVDPVCGMTVAVAGAPTALRDGVAFHFCSTGCRDQFEKDAGA